MKLKLPLVKATVKTMVGAVLLCGIATLVATPAQAQAKKGIALNAVVKLQIAALQNEKARRTPAQKKLSSQLIYEIKANRNQAVAQGVGRLRTNVAVANNRALVDIKGTVSPPLLALITKAGGTVVSSYARFKAIRAWLPLKSMEALAGRGDVKSIRPADIAITSSGYSEAQVTTKVAAKAITQGAASKDFQSAALLKSLREIRRQGKESKQVLLAAGDKVWNKPRMGKSGGKAGGLVPNVGSLTSEGDAAHAADKARTMFSVDGTGVKIGVLSDSVDGLASAQASGDLPANVTVLAGQSGVPASGEGTAMLEIVHDIAPGAQLYFASAFGGPARFAQNILNLRAAGCDIIIDDVSYGFDDVPFQDGLISQAVNTVSADGALYFSSAANSGNKNDGTSGTYEGDFLDAGAGTGLLAGTGNVHDFGGGATFNAATKAGSGAILYWADPLGASNNDYDLYFINPSGTAVDAASTDTQDGTQDPIEGIGPLPVGERIVVVKSSGADRFFHIDALRGRLTVNTEGSTRGHNASGAPNAFSVAATDATNSAPNAFVGGTTNPVETFSSDGPRRIFYNADGSAITPGNFSATGGKVLQKPDITAADGVQCVTAGFNPFYGTSAAAPHAGALAALIKEYKPSLSPAQIRNIMQNSALDTEAVGVDRDSGYGILIADQFFYYLTVDDVAINEGNTGTTNADFTVTLGAAAPGAVTVAYATADGTATAGSDYTATSGTLTFAPGELTKTISVPIIGDTTTEGDETFFVNLTAPTNAVLASTQGTGTITDDDAAALPSVSIADATAANEGSAVTPGSADFTVTLSAASTQTVTVDYATANGTAMVGNDFVASNGTLTFAPNELTKTITVNFVGDAVTEPDETFTVNLSNPANATLGTAQGTGTITDDDAATPALTLSIADAADANEGSAAAPGSADFTVTLSAASTQDVTVDYATANGTATAGADFVAANGTLTFAPNELTKTITVNFIGDAVPEPNETFLVNLSNPTIATIADGQTQATILNDDAAPLPDLSIGDVTVTEGDTGTTDAVFNVTLSAAATSTVSVTYATADGTATAGRDYIAANGTLSFAPGESAKSITVKVNGDTLVEGNETFVVNLTAPVNAALGDAQGQGTITDDEGLPQVAIGDSLVTEGNLVGGVPGVVSATFKVTLSVASAQAVRVTVTTADGTAVAPEDYTSLNTTLTFAPGETTKTVVVPVLGDNIDEADETFSVVLSAPVNAAISPVRGRGTGTIRDDDGAPSITFGEVRIDEGNNGLSTAVFTLQLSAQSGRTLKFNYSTSDGTATAGKDYMPVTNKEIIFTAGQTQATAQVLIIGDLLNEADETFYVNLSNVTGSNIYRKQTKGIIVNDDRAPNIAVNDARVAEGQSGQTKLNFTVSLSEASAQTVTVNYSTADGTANANTDYLGISGTLSFAPGETSKTLSVPVLGDRISEANELMYLLLTASTNSIIQRGRGVGTIINDDASQ